MIKAECHSDDRKIEASFDAEPYLIQATDDQIKSLIACGLGGDYPADRIVEFFAGTLNDVRKMFDYCADKDEGFECHITDTEAFWTWIKKNRPALQNGEALLERFFEILPQEVAADKLQSMVAILILDMDKDALYLSKSKNIDEDMIERLRQIAISCIPDLRNNLFLE